MDLFNDLNAKQEIFGWKHGEFELCGQHWPTKRWLSPMETEVDWYDVSFWVL
jgi:hypothetical protein